MEDRKSFSTILGIYYVILGIFIHIRLTTEVSTKVIPNEATDTYNLFQLEKKIIGRQSIQ